MTSRIRSSGDRSSSTAAPKHLVHRVVSANVLGVVEQRLAVGQRGRVNAAGVLVALTAREQLLEQLAERRRVELRASANDDEGTSLIEPRIVVTAPHPDARHAAAFCALDGVVLVERDLDPESELRRARPHAHDLGLAVDVAFAEQPADHELVEPLRRAHPRHRRRSVQLQPDRRFFDRVESNVRRVDSAVSLVSSRIAHTRNLSTVSSYGKCLACQRRVRASTVLGLMRGADRLVLRDAHRCHPRVAPERPLDARRDESREVLARRHQADRPRTPGRRG